MRKHTLVKIVKGEHAKGKHPVRQYRVCASHKKRSATALHLQVLCDASSQRGMFPEISHSQALLGAKILVHKIN
jgi:hypothetical protein